MIIHLLDNHILYIGFFILFEVNIIYLCIAHTLKQHERKINTF